MNPKAEMPSLTKMSADFYDPGLSVGIHADAGSILGLDDSMLPEFIHSALQEHHRLLDEQSDRVRKNAPESAVTLVEVVGCPKVCVKELRWRGTFYGLKSLLRPTQGLRTFMNGWRLTNAGFHVAAPLALIRRKRHGLVRSEWVVMEVIPRSLELDRYLVLRISQNWTAEEKRGMSRLLGRYIGSMHANGIFHADLKTCNILVSEEQPTPEDITTSGNWRPKNPCRAIRFSLLDYDDVRFSQEVSDKKRIKNLVQIFLSMPTAISAGDRLRFLNEYALHVGLSVAQRRETALMVLQAARGKQILYVGFDGDVIEKWDWSDSGP